MDRRGIGEVLEFLSKRSKNVTRIPIRIETRVFDRFRFARSGRTFL
jgi:hypothetical protein